MSKCTCPDSVFWDGIRYCPDCNTHTPAFTTAELNRKVQEILHRKAKEELLEKETKMKSFEVHYQVKYKCRIDIDAPDGVIDREGLTAAISDIEIPEGGHDNSEYVEGSFIVTTTREIVNESPRLQEGI